MNPGEIIVGQVTGILPVGDVSTGVMIWENRPGGLVYRHTVRAQRDPASANDSSQR
jgi:hypothetical protein